MPIYTYKCSKCDETIEDLRKMENRDLEEVHSNACPGVLQRKLDFEVSVTIADPKKEPVQYWRKNPNAPNGMEVFPHRNKYIKGGLNK